jgi:DNA repair photolyase
MLRLPLEVQDIFGEWLLENAPDKYRRVMSLMRSMREGKVYDASFGKRMTGTGPYAGITGRRFEAAALRLGFNEARTRLRTDLFRPPVRPGGQMSLF